jgi:fatty-acyl-CoA synthase
MTATMAELLTSRARAAEEAVVMGDRRLTFDEWEALTATFARRLLGLGLEPGDRVAVLHADSVEQLGALFGAMRVGLVPVPVNGRYKSSEVAFVTAQSGARLLLVDQARAPAAVESACYVIVGLNATELADAGGRVAAAEVHRLGTEVEPDDPALILYTSGTTANPKGCVYSHGGYRSQADSFAAALELRSDDRFWTPLPLYHVSALVTIAACLSARTAFVHVGERFDPGPALRLLADERCTIAFPAFETIWLGVLNHPDLRAADISTLRTVINVGTPGSLRRMQAKLPSVPQISSFGGTEYGGFNALGRPDDPLEARITTSGRPFPNVELRVVDPETGADLPVGEPGEILMRGDMRFVRYHDDPEQTSRAIDDDGWFHSGDLGRFDTDGRFAFVGRLKDMLKVGGENVSAAEVETYLLTHPDVEIAQVVAAPDARYTEVPAAFVQLRPGSELEEQELVDFCLGRIATFKVPRYVRFVEEWPMSGTKIQKFKLRERIGAELRDAGITEAQKLRAHSPA